MDSPEDQQAIRDVFQAYLEGIDNLDARRIKSIFYPDARLVTQTETELCDHAADDWDSIIDKARSDPNHPFRQSKANLKIIYIDITGTAAAVKAEWAFPAYIYTEYYNLLKIEGRWYIMHQVYYGRKNN